MKKLFLLMMLTVVIITAMGQDKAAKDTNKTIKDTTVSKAVTAKPKPVQESLFVEMANKMRSDGKIYVVISTLSIVFIGIAIYLFAIDRRLRKLEK